MSRSLGQYGDGGTGVHYALTFRIALHYQTRPSKSCNLLLFIVYAYPEYAILRPDIYPKSVVQMWDTWRISDLA